MQIQGTTPKRFDFDVRDGEDNYIHILYLDPTDEISLGNRGNLWLPDNRAYVCFVTLRHVCYDGTPVIAHYAPWHWDGRYGLTSVHKRQFATWSHQPMSLVLDHVLNQELADERKRHTQEAANHKLDPSEGLIATPHNRWYWRCLGIAEDQIRITRAMLTKARVKWIALLHARHDAHDAFATGTSP